MRRIIAWTTLTTALAFAAIIPGNAGEVVEIRLRGHYYSEPATVLISVAVEPGERNRVLRVEADGERYFRSSDVTLSGASEKKIHTVEFKNLPAGSYMLRAEVHSSSELLGLATQELFVTGIGGK